MKTCTKCKTPKTEAEFGIRNRRGRTELLPRCKKCLCFTFKEWRHAHPETVQAQKQKYCENNRERINTLARIARASGRWTKSDRREYQRKWKAERERTDIGFKIKCRLRVRLCDALKENRKCGSTLELLGCPVVWLQVHLESLFRPGMTWENYGPIWHVDHIKPCAAFDLTDPEQQKACFHWTNLQPLFVEENLKKSDTYTA